MLERPLESQRQAPAARAPGLEQGRRVLRGLKRVGRPGREKKVGPTVQNALGGAQGDDQIGFHERPVGQQGHSFQLAERREIGSLEIVNGDQAMESATELRRHERGQLPAPGLAGQAGGDENRLSAARDTGRLEPVGGGDQCLDTRISLGARHGQCGWLDHDRRALLATGELGQRGSRQGEAEGVTDGRCDIDDALPGRRRWRKRGAVFRHLEDDRARAGEKRDTDHQDKP